MLSQAILDARTYRFRLPSDKMSDIYPMNILCMFKFILSSKDYDLNMLRMSFIFELYNERNSSVKND